MKDLTWINHNRSRGAAQSVRDEFVVLQDKGQRQHIIKAALDQLLVAETKTKFPSQNDAPGGHS